MVRRQERAQLFQRLERHAAAGVREVTQMLPRGRGPFELGKLDVERRHGSEPRHPFVDDRVEHVARQQVVEQHDPSTDVKRGRELTEAGVERERERSQQRVARVILEVARDALGTTHHVSMGEHHPLRVAGASRRVQDRHDIGVDQAVAGSGRRLKQLAPAMKRDRVRPRKLARVVDDDDVPQIRTTAQHRLEQLQAIAGRDQHAHAAVTNDIRDLVRLQQRIEGHEYRPRRRRPKGRDDGLGALLEINADPLAAAHVQPDERHMRMHRPRARALRRRASASPIPAPAHPANARPRR